MLTPEPDHPVLTRTYRITLEGVLSAGWADWLGVSELVSYQQGGRITYTALTTTSVDQAALRGLLNRLWDLNLVLHAIQPVEPATQVPEK